MPEFSRRLRSDTYSSHTRSIERTIATMRERLNEKLSLQDMAAVAYMSPFHFSRVFRNVTGIPPSRYLSALRLETAKRLLLTTDLSVTDICFEVGYASLGSFTRRFTELLGASPRRLRRLARRQREVRPPLRVCHEPSPEQAGEIRGQVTAPPDFRGWVFVGLFDHAIVQGNPATWSWTFGPGKFRLGSVHPGHYHICAVGFSIGKAQELDYLSRSSWRAVQEIAVARSGRALPEIRLDLRHSTPIDPPILTTLNLLQAQTA